MGCVELDYMKITELKPVRPEKVGHLNGSKYYNDLEPHEKRTIKFLLGYGFDIDVLAPSGTPKTNNPDVTLNGVVWEMKAPMGYNETTLFTRMKKASRQANRVIVDLRNAGRGADPAEQYVIKFFKNAPRLRRMIIIEKCEKVLDFRKD